MKKIIKLCTFFLGILIVIAVGVSAFMILRDDTKDKENEKPVFDRTPLDRNSVFGDYVFEEKIRAVLSLKKDEKIDLGKLSSITELDLSSNDSGSSTDKIILSLEGLKHFPSLTRLVIDKNRVKSLEPLKQCKSLISFSAKDCGLKNEDVTVLSEFQGLIYLNLRGNTLTELDFLSSLRNLQILDIGQNDFSDDRIFGKTVFGNLRQLYIDTTEVEDITNICNYQKSLEILNISGLQIYDKDIEPLKNLKNLKTVFCEANNIETVSVFTELPKLESLFLKSNRVKDLKPLKDCKLLKELDLSFNFLYDIEGIENIENLTRFNGANNRISSFAPLDKATKLEYIKVDNDNYCKGE